MGVAAGVLGVDVSPDILWWGREGERGRWGLWGCGGGKGKIGTGKGRGKRYLLLKSSKLLFFLLAVLFDFLLGFVAGVFDAFCAVCLEGVSVSV